MTTDRRERARSVFMEVAGLPPAERPEALSLACGEDVALRAEVEALLQADGEAGGFMASPSGGGAGASVLEMHFDATNASPAGAPVGQQIGRYKLLELLGEGGFGSVWMAEQREPVKRRVAVKLIKLGMDTKQVIARFESERQALALMDHPHIAKVFDAGSTETGRPYFVMEYIRGVPIVKYCDTEKLDTRSRLGLFTSVCHAIQHAHQKGIIHRDIKPGNILVTLHDGVPVPKVIDFGIAKATGSELTARTLFTGHQQMLGTPAYMSPEQAEMSGLDIDTRSDIYSLGVLLYELLTGSTPFHASELMTVGYDEMMRIIREVEPQKPSTRVSTRGEDGAPAARRRWPSDPEKLSLLLQGDLDWIVMKCLEKDRRRRYETANGLAADIKRHLNDEPVTAGPPGAAYRVRKFVRRHRAHVIAGGIVAAFLVLGLAGTTGGMIFAGVEKARADAAKDVARHAASAEAEAKVRARENTARARAAAQRAEAAQVEEARARKRAVAVSRFVCEALNAGDAYNDGGGEDVTIVAAMRQALGTIDAGRFEDDAETEADLKATIALILQGNGQPEEALAIFRRLSPDGSPMLARALWQSGSVRLENQDAAAALPEFEEAATMAAKVLPPGHSELPSYREALDRCRTALGLEPKSGTRAVGDRK